MKNYSMLLLILVSTSFETLANNEDFRDSKIKPNIGVMSEEVVREKFKSYGLEITKLERQNNNYIVHTLIEGKQALLELESATGGLKLEGRSLRLQPTSLATEFVIKPDHHRIPWVERTIRFEKINIEGIRLPIRSLQH